jgi:hypothetical protein
MAIELNKEFIEILKQECATITAGLAEKKYETAVS